MNSYRQLLAVLMMILLNVVIVQSFTCGLNSSSRPALTSPLSAKSNKMAEKGWNAFKQLGLLPVAKHTKSKADIDLEELQMAARSPEAFEAYVKSKNKTGAEDVQKKDVQKKSSVEATSKPDAEAHSSSPPKTKKGYVPIEQWDKERSDDEMAWEQKVQFDGQRYGNKFNQNEILRKNLKSW